MKSVKIFLAGDHAGFELKEKLKNFLKEKFIIEDFGPHSFDSQDDYPDFVLPLADKVSKTKNSRGIIIAGSGQGEVIAANKIKGIRAALYYGHDLSLLKLSREHNDSNVLCLGARFLEEKEAKKAINIWLKTKFEGGRHLRRLKKYEKYGSKL